MQHHRCCRRAQRFVELFSSIPESTMEQVDMALRVALNVSSFGW